MDAKKARKLSKESQLIIISCIVYGVVLIIHFIYTYFTSREFGILISDQLVFYNRGVGALTGQLPYRDFYTNAAPLSPYLWAPLVLVSMVGTNYFSTDFLTSENYSFSASMMLSTYIFRIFFAVCLILSAVLLYRLEEKRKNKRAFLIALVYSLNPFFLHLIFFWGSDEAIVPLLILLPIYLFERGNNTLASLLIIIGAGLKYFPILMVPLIWIYAKNWRERMIQTLIFIIMLLAITLPFYLIAPAQFIDQFVDPVGAPVNEGILTVIQSYFNINLENIRIAFPIITIVLVIYVGFILFLTRKHWVYHQTIVLFLIFLIFYQKMQISYIVLIFPFIFVLFFNKSKIRWIYFSFYTLGIFEGVFAEILINGFFQHKFWHVISWIWVCGFYLIMIGILILFQLRIHKNFYSLLRELKFKILC